MFGNYLQQMTSADDIFRYIFFLRFKGLLSLDISCFEKRVDSDQLVSEKPADLDPHAFTPCL